jgi:hypothetical protein
VRREKGKEITNAASNPLLFFAKRNDDVNNSNNNHREQKLCKLSGSSLNGFVIALIFLVIEIFELVTTASIEPGERNMSIVKCMSN